MDLYLLEIAGIMLVVIIESALIAILLVNHVRRKRAEAGLRDQQETINAFIETSQDWIWAINAQGIHTYTNPAIEKILGYQLEEIVGGTNLDLLHEDDKKLAQAALDDGLKNHRGWSKLLLRWRQKDGTYRFLESNAVPIQNSEGVLTGFRGVDRDITENKHAELALKVSEEQFRRIFVQGPIGIALSDRTFHFVQVNDCLCEMLGYTKEEMSRLTFKEITHPDHLEVDAKEVAKLARGEIDIYKTENRYIKKDGQVIWGALTISVLHDSNCELLYFLVMIENITDRKLAEERIREINERFRSVLRASTAYAIIGMDTEGVIRVFNVGAELMLGYQAADVIDKQRVEIFHDPEELCSRAEELGAETGLEAITAAAYRGEMETREWTFIRKDGRRITVSLTVTAMKSRDGSLEGCIAIARDITGEKEREQQLLQSQKLESLGLLAGGVAHDFNNLLTPILGYIDILQNDLMDGDPHFQQLEYMKKAAERAQELIRRLLVFGRKQVITCETVSLGEIIRRSETILRRMIRENIQINIVIPEKLRPIKADAGQIEQILINLSINAQDAMPEGGVLTIKASNKETKDANGETNPGNPFQPGVILEIIDTGAGIDDETMRHIFDPFYTTKEVGKGTGLGLPTVYGIVKQHGASISVYSEKDKGSIFRVFFPQSDREEMIRGTDPGIHSVIRGGIEKILVVEDNQLVLTLSRDMLVRLGYQVISAENAAACLEIMKKEGDSINLLLTDVVMPGMSGPELYNLLRRDYPGLKVLFMSGHIGKEGGQQEIIRGGHPFIHKPFSYKNFGKKIRDVLDK